MNLSLFIAGAWFTSLPFFAITIREFVPVRPALAKAPTHHICIQ
jgi:hypothetical protein